MRSNNKIKLIKSVNLHILLLQNILFGHVFCFQLFNLFPAKSVEMRDLFTFLLKATLKGLQSIRLRYYYNRKAEQAINILCIVRLQNTILTVR